ncbi:MAG: hypothetical protein M1837_005232 [Sclerophora amabilis]|nr:MAG: hypothetical protein M1837_005232 [Sclerophora amabilis]
MLSSSLLMFTGLLLLSALSDAIPIDDSVENGLLIARQLPPRKWELTAPDPNPLRPRIPYGPAGQLALAEMLILGVFLRDLLYRALHLSQPGFNSYFVFPHSEGFQSVRQGLALFVSIENQAPDDTPLEDISGIREVTNGPAPTDLINTLQGEIAINNNPSGRATLPRLASGSEDPVRAVIQYLVVEIAGPFSDPSPAEQNPANHQNLPGGSGNGGEL